MITRLRLAFVFCDGNSTHAVLVVFKMGNFVCCHGFLYILKLQLCTRNQCIEFVMHVKGFRFT